ncbi:MAG: hypothetical protein CMF62_01840 [Magnetococcales bacterium]|nr:hypothetical protein [Magnetococcales bacterium]|tara:strand:+ start:96225 stop:97025 length:801 start_codon:yes stop_codon:yes gene_type:complete
MVVPNFMIIGVQKGGTQSALYHLNQHPDVYLLRKEVHHFDTNKYSLEEYHSLFENENPFDNDKLAVGEKTPTYLLLRSSIDRLHKYNPDLKIIVFLREPISRAFSHYRMMKFRNKKSKNKFNLSFREFINYDIDTKIKNIKDIYSEYPFQRGLYYKQLKYLFNKFNKNNILIVLSEKVLKVPFRQYNRIFKFLGVRKLRKREFKFKKNIHKTKFTETLKNKDFKYLFEKYKEENKKLYELLGFKIWAWENKYKNFFNDVKNKNKKE